MIYTHLLRTMPRPAPSEYAMRKNSKNNFQFSHIVSDLQAPVQEHRINAKKEIEKIDAVIFPFKVCIHTSIYTYVRRRLE